MEKPIPGNKITWIMIILCLLKMTSTCVTTLLLRSLVVKNTGSTQANQKLTQILPFAILLKGLSLIQFCRLFMMKERFTYS